MALQNLLCTKKDHILRIALNRPPANAFNLAALLELEETIREAERDRDTRVIVLTGTGGKGFSAGLDVNEIADGDAIGPIGRSLLQRIERFPKPVLAAINGYALGGGCELAMACTFRIMQEKAEIGLPELNLGIMPAWGGTLRLPRLVGKAKALEMILFSRKISAQEALAIGLVDRVCTEEGLMAEVMAMADLLAKRPPLAVQAVLKVLAAGGEEGTVEGYRREALECGAVARSRDAREGIAAFLQKREPRFEGL